MIRCASNNSLSECGAINASVKPKRQRIAIPFISFWSKYAHSPHAFLLTLFRADMNVKLFCTNSNCLFLNNLWSRYQPITHVANRITNLTAWPKTAIWSFASWIKICYVFFRNKTAGEFWNVGSRNKCWWPFICKWFHNSWNRVLIRPHCFTSQRELFYFLGGKIQIKLIIVKWWKAWKCFDLVWFSGTPKNVLTWCCF